MKYRLIPPFIITFLLFLIPFFWFKPGEMDLGGDSSRLYFYDPMRYLISQALYATSNSGLGGESLGYFGIPFFLFLAGLKSILRSPTALIVFVHGVSLSVAFVSGALCSVRFTQTASVERYCYWNRTVFSFTSVSSCAADRKSFDTGKR